MLYRWRSNALKNYSQGYLIAYAKSIEDAREFIRKEFTPWLIENHGWLYKDDLPYDDESAIEIEQFKERLERDLEVEPETKIAFLISGSE